MISSESLQSAISVRMLDTFGPEYKKAPNVDVVRVMQARKNRPYNTTLKEAARMLNGQMYLVHKYCSQEEKTSLYTHLTSYAKELHAQAKYAPSPVIIAELQQEVKEVVERNQLARRLRCVCKQPLSSPSNTQTGVLSFEMWALVESTNYKTIERKLRQRVGARLRQKEHVPFFLDLMEDVLGVGPIDSRYLMDRIEFHETNRVF
jgi:hypothetical protein